jgi:hypothetical protein
MLPLLISLVALRGISYLVNHLSIRVVVVSAAFGWTMIASTKFLGTLESSRRALVLYPVALYYLTISWLIINDN